MKIAAVCAMAMFLPLAELRERGDVKRTFITPACGVQFDGERIGKYILA